MTITMKLALFIVFIDITLTPFIVHGVTNAASLPKARKETKQFPEFSPLFQNLRRNTPEKSSHGASLPQHDLADIRASEKNERELDQLADDMAFKKLPRKNELHEPSSSSSFSSFLNEREMVDSFIDTVMACKDVPGLSVAVVFKESERWTKGYGVVDVESGRRVDSRTLFGLGSLTKAFTAALLAVALDETQRMGEQVSWQTLVKDVMASDLNLAGQLEDNVTLADILAHRTGIMAADLLAVAGFPARFSRKQFLRELHHLTEFLPFRYFWHYNNWIFSLAADVTEYLMGDKWNTLLKERLLFPLGMDDAVIVWDDINVTSSKMAHPYQKIRGRLQEVDTSMFEMRQGKPSGALAVSADDMAKWMTWLLRQGVLPSGERLLDQRLVQDMMTSQTPLGASYPDVPVGDTLEGYGFAWFTGTYRGKRRVSHTGGWFGYQTSVSVFPDDDVAIYVATNGPGTAAASEAYRTISYFLSDIALGYSPWLERSSVCAFGEGERRRNTENVDEAEVEIEVRKVENPHMLVGTYSNPLLGDVVIKSSESSNGLVLQLQRLSGVLIPSQREFEFQVQYTGHTAFYSQDDFELKRSWLSFSRHSLTPEGQSASLVLRAPPPNDEERLEFTRTS